jgi:dGTP triphosphohydrolase
VNSSKLNIEIRSQVSADTLKDLIQAFYKAENNLAAEVDSALAAQSAEAKAFQEKYQSLSTEYKMDHGEVVGASMARKAMMITLFGAYMVKAKLNGPLIDATIAEISSQVLANPRTRLN